MKIISDRKLKQRDDEFFQKGIAIGFKYGLAYGRTLSKNGGIFCGVVIPPQLEREIEEILKEKGE